MVKSGIHSVLNPEDYYIEDEKIVLTADYLLRRGFCCGNLCRNCPYGEEIQRAAGMRPTGRIGHVSSPPDSNSDVP